MEDTLVFPPWLCFFQSSPLWTFPVLEKEQKSKLCSHCFHIDFTSSRSKKAFLAFCYFYCCCWIFFLNWPLLPTDSLQWFGLYHLTCFVFTGPPFMTRSRFVTWQQTYFCFFQDSGSVLNADLSWLQNTFPQSCVEAGFLHPVSLFNTNLPLASG